MNLCEELAELSRHLMLFLVAIFAFSSQGVIDFGDGWASGLYIASLLLAVLSFFAGYSTLFRLFNDEMQYPTEASKPCRPTSKALTRIKIQYALTIFALACAMCALIRIMWIK